MIDEPYVSGWVDDAGAVEAIAQQQPFPTFGETPAGNAVEPPAEIFGWKLHEQLTGTPWPARNQGKIGSCVAFGTAAAIEYTMISEIINRQPEQFKPLAQEVIYAGSRVEIGNGRIKTDGSIGAWAAEFVKRYGVIPREIVGNYDLRQYSEQRCRAWGATGVPDDLEPEARIHQINSISKVTTTKQARQALANGYGIAVCSARGFTMARDSEGFCQPSGRWNHCMALIGYQSGKRPGFFIVNSWGPAAHTGPVGNGNPPTSGFYADDSVVETMLSAGDSWAFSDLVGFPIKQIDWKI